MRLFAIGDLHLHFGSELKAPGQLTGRRWKDHERIFADACARLIAPEDTLLLAGDHSWGKNMRECQPDFEYILRLPGKMQAVIGTTKADRVTQSAAACDIELTRKEWYEIYLAAGNKLA